jgi:VanZ family protein
MPKFLVRLLRWLPAVLLMATIFAFSSVPSYEMPNFAWADTLVKKGGHMLGYGLLALTYLWGLRAGSPRGSKVTLVEARNAWLLTLLYACTDEFHQLFVAGRHASLVDVGIDALGAAIALAIWNWSSRRIK